MSSERDAIAAAMRHAEQLLSAGDRTAARAVYESLRACAPSMPEPAIRLGVMCVQAGDHVGAIDQFSRALALEQKPDRGRVLCLRATSFLSLGQVSQAADDVRMALDDDAGDPAARLLHARILLVTAQPREARAVVDDLLAFQEQPDALGLSAELHELAGDVEAAARDRARATEIVSGPMGAFKRFWKPRA